MEITPAFKKILVFTAVIFILSIIYFVFAKLTIPAGAEKETFLTELGEGFGEIGLLLLLFIYARTALKLILGKGPIAKRMMPEYTSPIDASLFNKLMRFLDRTHVYVGIASVAIILIHIFLMDFPMDILFFPASLALIVWQAVFGLFITWKYTPTEIKKVSYVVHAQLFTGIMLGIFAFMGHVLID